VAIYHLSTKVISRASGRNVVNAAAYRRGAEMTDERSASTWNYERKKDVTHSELAIPENAPAWARRIFELHAADPVRASEALWNRVEQHEKRKDAQLAREVEFALPKELTDEQRVALVREFVTEQLAGRGMVADWSIHQGNGNENNHAHVLLTMRPLTENGFGTKKVPMLDPETGVPLRDGRGKIRYAFGDAWGTKEELLELREKWAEYQNFRLAMNGHEVRVDHRSFQECGIELTPTTHIGASAFRMNGRGKPAERMEEHKAERLENAQKIRERPEHVFDLITHRQAVFSWKEVEREVGRYVDDPEVLQGVMRQLSASRERVELAAEDRSETGVMLKPARYSTRDMVLAERRMVETADRIAAMQSYAVEWGHVEAALLRRSLSDEQRSAVVHMTAGGRVATVAGAAGAGKSMTLTAAREAWEAQGYRVRGAALAGIAAEGLQEGAGIESRTIHSLEYAWKNGRDQLTSRDVLVIDEAGLVGSRQLGRVFERADQAGAKVVLVGDARQLQPIEAGAAFRAVAERVGVVEIETIRRQREAWARQASQDFARGDISAGLEAYRCRGQVELLSSRKEAKEALARDWMEQRASGSSIILAHTNQDVHDLNEVVRRARRLAGELGEETPFSAPRGVREFAAGDRLVFLENNRDLGVKNGTLGTVERARQGELEVRLDGGGMVQVREAEYPHIDHGYAVTIHKAQGVTVDRALVLASGGMDRHLAYVAMTRHREQATLYAGLDDFKDHRALVARLSRARPKESTLDFAERRGIDTPKSFIENARAWVERGRERLAEIWLRAERAMEGIRALEREAEHRADLVVPPREREQTLPGTLLARDGQRVVGREDQQGHPRPVVGRAREDAPASEGWVVEHQKRVSQGEKQLETKWNAAVAKEHAGIRTRAEGIARRVGKDIAELRERMAKHSEVAPRKPKAITSLLGGRARYEAARDIWWKEHKALENRYRQLEKRAGWVREYGREPVTWYPGKGAQLAQRKAERQEPELARQVGEYRGSRQAQQRERVTRENEQRREKEREFERGEWEFER